MPKLINNHSQPISLEGGTILAAAGTEGYIKEVDSISDRDRRRHVDTERIRIVEEAVAPSGTSRKSPKEDK